MNSSSIFNRNQPSISENIPNNNIVGTVEALDQDTVTNLVFSLIDDANGMFKLDPTVTCQNNSDSNGKLYIILFIKITNHTYLRFNKRYIFK